MNIKKNTVQNKQVRTGFCNHEALHKRQIYISGIANKVIHGDPGQTSTYCHQCDGQAGKPFKE